MTASKCTGNPNDAEQEEDEAVVKSKYHLFLSSPLFVVCWWTMVAVHLMDLAFLVATTRMYFWILRDSSASYFLFGNLTMDLSATTLFRLAFGFAGVAALHGLVLARLMYRSVKHRQLFMSKYSPEEPVDPRLHRTLLATLTSRMLLKSSKAAPHASPMASLLSEAKPDDQTRVEQPQEAKLCCLVKSCCCCLDGIVNGYEFIMNKLIRPVFFLRGRYFDDASLVQECCEFGFQVYQARQMSIFVATRWINNVFVTMIFLNSISRPLLYYRMHSPGDAPYRRLLAVLMNGVLNFVNAVVIPVVIFAKYVAAYDPETHFFAQEHLFDDVWYVKAVRENQQLFVTSLFDFVSTLWPHVSLWNGLRVCESLFHRQEVLRVHNRKVRRTRRSLDVARSLAVAFSKKLLMNQTNNSVLQHSPSTPNLLVVPTKQRLLRFVRSILYNLLLIAGMVVVIIHLDAQVVPPVPGCLLDSASWFSGGKSACVVMNINCYRREIQGNASEIDAILRQFKTEAMLILSFTHCPALEIPSVVRSFHSLNGIDIYNCTVHDWSIESAVSEQDFPLLSYVYFVRSKLSSVPSALVEHTLPPTVLEMYFYDTNLSTLPAIVAAKWSSLPILNLEFSHFQKIPPVLSEMNLQFLYLTGNPLTGVSDGANVFTNTRSLQDFRASGTPFKVFPSKSNLNEMLWLFVEFTELQQVPLYLREWYLDGLEQGKGIQHSLFGSPFCNNTSQLAEENDEAQSHEAEEDEETYRQQVCTKNYGTSSGFYPIDVVVPQREL